MEYVLHVGVGGFLVVGVLVGFWIVVVLGGCLLGWVVYVEADGL